MSRFDQVDPEKFINVSAKVPLNGRGAWTRAGIGFSGAYELAPEGEKRIGTQAEVSLDHWAAAVGVLAIQTELKARTLDVGALDGIFGPMVDRAVRKFQTNNGLVVDGQFGRASARALFTPAIDAAEDTYDIPSHFLRGMINAESALDPGAVGYYIYYGEELSYRGVDRGVGQINSKAHPEISWLSAFNYRFAADYTADRLRDTFNSLRRTYPTTSISALWDAAIVSHNNPSAGRLWARNGVPPTEAAALYVSKVKTAIY